MNNDEVRAAIERLRYGVDEAGDLHIVLDALHDARTRAAEVTAAWAKVAAAATDAEADAQRLAERVRSVRLMFETAGMHRTAEDMDDVLDQHDALVSKRAAT